MSACPRSPSGVLVTNRYEAIEEYGGSEGWASTRQDRARWLSASARWRTRGGFTQRTATMVEESNRWASKAVVHARDARRRFYAASAGSIRSSSLRSRRRNASMRCSSRECACADPDIHVAYRDVSQPTIRRRFETDSQTAPARVRDRRGAHAKSQGGRRADVTGPISGLRDAYGNGPPRSRFRRASWLTTPRPLRARPTFRRALQGADRQIGTMAAGKNWPIHRRRRLAARRRYCCWIKSRISTSIAAEEFDIPAPGGAVQPHKVSDLALVKTERCLYPGKVAALRGQIARPSQAAQ